MSITPEQQLHGAQIAYRIRAELVCCDIYGRVHDIKELTIGQALRSRDWHGICFWGEAAARIAETPSQWEGDPDECAQGCPPKCRHQRAAEELTRLDEEIVQEYGEITAARLEGSCSARGEETVPNTLTLGAPRPDDPDWSSPEDATYDHPQEQQ